MALAHLRTAVRLRLGAGVEIDLACVPAALRAAFVSHHEALATLRAREFGPGGKRVLVPHCFAWLLGNDGTPVGFEAHRKGGVTVSHVVLPRFLATRLYGESRVASLYAAGHTPDRGRFWRADGEAMDETRGRAVDALSGSLTRRHGGLLKLPCGVGKTRIVCCALQRLGAPAAVIVDQRDIANGWIDEARLACPDVRVELVQGARAFDKWDTTPVSAEIDLFVVMVKTVAVHGHWPRGLAHIHAVAIDEAHGLPCDTYTSVLRMLPGSVHHVFGVTATPDKDNGLTDAVYWHAGPLIDLPYRFVVDTAPVERPAKRPRLVGGGMVVRDEEEPTDADEGAEGTAFGEEADDEAARKKTLAVERVPLRVWCWESGFGKDEKETTPAFVLLRRLFGAGAWARTAFVADCVAGMMHGTGPVVQAFTGEHMAPPRMGIIVFGEYRCGLQRVMAALRSRLTPAELETVHMYTGLEGEARHVESLATARVLLTTYGKLRKGVNTKRFDACVLFGPTKHVIQCVGRIQRVVKDADGNHVKKDAWVVDVRDAAPLWGWLARVRDSEFAELGARFTGLHAA